MFPLDSMLRLTIHFHATNPRQQVLENTAKLITDFRRDHEVSLSQLQFIVKFRRLCELGSVWGPCHFCLLSAINSFFFSSLTSSCYKSDWKVKLYSIHDAHFITTKDTQTDTRIGELLYTNNLWRWNI